MKKEQSGSPFTIERMSDLFETSYDEMVAQSWSEDPPLPDPDLCLCCRREECDPLYSYT